MAIEFIFILFLWFLIGQRLFELRVAKRNTKILLEKGAIELGRNHYRHLVLMHVLFFVSMIFEAQVNGPQWGAWSNFWITLFAVAQIGRAWVMKTMKDRWTTRVLVVPGETLIAHGPFRYIPHPNYTIVALEIATLPLSFGLYWTAIVFTLANAIMILGIRIPTENKALRWARRPT